MTIAGLNVIAYVGDTSIVEYNAYVTACSDMGFIVDTNNTDKHFSAKNNDSFKVSVDYNGNNIMCVYLSREDFSEILADAWIRSENPNSGLNLTKSLLLRMFKDADPAILMSPKEQTQLETLDDPVTIYQSELPSRAVTVYYYLLDRANKDGKCFPAIPTIAYETKLSRSTVKRALDDLQRAGFLTRECRYRNKGGNSSNLYSLKIPP